MRKKFIGLFSILVISILFSSTALAVNVIGDLSYWYSDSNRIAKWESTPSFSITGTSSTPYMFNTYVKDGFSKWNSAGVPNTYNTSSGKIPVYGGTYTEIKAMYPSFPTTATAVTSYTIISLNGVYRTPSGNKDGYKMSSAKIYFATDRANTKTYAHEAGHSLGWLGHSSNSSDIMYGTQTTKTSLTTRDKKHLNQIY